MQLNKNTGKKERAKRSADKSMVHKSAFTVQKAAFWLSSAFHLYLYAEFLPKLLRTAGSSLHPFFQFFLKMPQVCTQIVPTAVTL